MSKSDKRSQTMLAPSREERIQNYLRTSLSTEDIVREVTAAFANDVARIMGREPVKQRSPDRSDAGEPDGARLRRR